MNPNDDSSKYLQNASTLPPDYTTQHNTTPKADNVENIDHKFVF
jgi:hypothetical protein